MNSYFDRSSGHRWVQILGAIVCVLTLSSFSARADLLAYEGFDYAPGSLGAMEGGIGFNGGWILGGNASNSIVVSGSFGFADSFGNSVVTSGNRVLFTGDGTAAGDNTGGNNGSASPRRTLTFTRGNTTETTWMSFIAQRTGLPTPYTNSLGHIINYGRATSFQLFYRADGTTGQGNEHVSIGRGSENTSGIDENATHDSWAILNRGTSLQQQASDVGFATAPADFILVRIDHVAGVGPQTNAAEADTAYVWINPQNLTKEPSLAKADLTIKPTTYDATNDRDYIFNQIRLFGGNYNSTVGYGSMELDEIKIGTTMFDVTFAAIPEPSTVALTALGGLAFLLRRRRL